MSTIQKFLTANRVAALATWLGGLAAFIVGVCGTLPASWQNVALAIAGVLTKLVTAMKFLDGSQKWDSLIARNAVIQRSVLDSPLGGPQQWATTSSGGLDISPDANVGTVSSGDDGPLDETKLPTDAQESAKPPTKISATIRSRPRRTPAPTEDGPEKSA